MKTFIALFASGLMATGAWAKPGPAFDVKGHYYETCDCAVSCPCATGKFLPTEGHCDFVSLFHIDKASVGKTKLDGLNMALVGRSPKDKKIVDAFGAGDMDHFAWYIDDKATEEQRKVIPQLIEGMFGKMEIKNAKAPAFAAVTLTANEDSAKFDIDNGKLTADIENIKVGETKFAGKTVAKRIKLDGAVPFPWITNTTQGRSNSFHYVDGTTKWDHKDKNAYFAEFATKGTLTVADAK